MAKKIKKSFKNIFTNIKKSNFFKRLGIAIGSSIVFIALVFCTLNFLYNQKVFPHTYIGSVNFGGLNRSQAEELLKSLENKNANGGLNFSFDGKDYNISNTDLKIDWNSKNHETLDRLMGVARTGGIKKVFTEQLAALAGKNQIYAAFSFDGVKLNEYITNITSDINIPEKNASIEFDGDTPVIIPEKIGQIFPEKENNKILLEKIGSFQTQEKTNFLVLKVYPQVNSQGAELALYETQAILQKILGLKAGDKTYDLKGKDLLGLLKYVTVSGNKGVLGISSEKSFEPKSTLVPFSLSLDANPDKIGELVDKIASEINQPAQDAKFEVTGGKVVAFQTAKTGYEIDKTKAIQIIIEALKNGSQTVELPVNKTEPAISDISTNNFKELVGEGTTSWRGSPPNRIHNLTLGANKISGTVVKPGEEFSTVKTIGVIGPSTGFLQELVIKNSNRVEPEYGGGLCQVSTTLFRAVLHAGLKITARTPHSFRVSYYEPPVGMDATIYDPSPDFKFINTYKTPILIWAIPGNNTLDFQIFGTSDNRKVEISDPVKYGYVSPGEAIYTETPTMASGAIRQVERATAGVSASFTYKVTASDGTVLENETFVSKYVPVPNSYLYGPGTTGIPGQEAAPAPVEPTPTPNIKENLIKGQ